MTVSKKLFLITEFHSSSQNSTGYLIEKLNKALLDQKDFKTVLLTKKDENIITQPNAIYVQQSDYSKNRLISRIWHELSLNSKFLIKSIQNISKDDLVITGTNPTFLLFIIFLLKKYIKFDWILLVHDVFPENLVASKTLSKDSLAYNFLKVAFDKIYASPDRVITIGKDMQQLINKKAKRNDAEVVPNWIDVKDIEVESKRDNQILKQLGLNNENKVVFSFFGNIGRVQGLDNLIEAINHMKELENAKFVFMGDGAYVEMLKSIISELGKENIIYYGKVEQQQKSLGLNACDISIVTLADGMLGLGVPSKAYYSMAADKPLFCIMHKESEIYTMVDENNMGWVVEPKNIQEVAQTLDQAVKEFNNNNFNSPRKILIEKYSDTKSIDKLISIVRSYI